MSYAEPVDRFVPSRYRPLPESPSTHREEPLLPRVAYVAGTFALYFFSQWASLKATAAIGQNTGLWPAAAVGLVLILGAPSGTRTAVAIATLLANLGAHLVLPALSGWPLIVGVMSRLAAEWGGALFVARVLGDHPSLERPDSFLKFAAAICLVVTPVTAILSAVLQSSGPSSNLLADFAHGYVPEVIMLLTLGPAVWVMRDAVARARRTDGVELAKGAGTLLVLAASATLAVFQPPVADITLPISLIVIPLLLFIAYRFGVGATSWGSIIIMGVLVAFTARGIGPFAATRAPGLPRFVGVELYVGAFAVPMVLLAAVLAELQESAARFQSFLDTAASPMLAVDVGRRIVGFSPAADQMFRRSAGVALHVGMDPLGPRIGSPEAMQRRAEGWERSLAGHEDVAILEPDPDTRFEMRYQPMRNARGEVVGAIATATDLLRRKRDEAESARLNRLEAIGRLAGGIVHDVNNLMTIVLGQVFTLRSTVGRVAGTDAPLREIETTVERTKRLAAQLLAFSRAQPMEPIVTELRAEIERTLDMLRRVLEEHAVLDPEYGSERWRIAIDRGQFEQLLLNLVTNARDAMPRGGRVRLTTAHVAIATEAAVQDLAAGEYATLEICDSGIGMTDEQLRRIFDPFYSTKGARGYGLGLATVHAIMRRAGGAVTVRSAPGEGTTFCLWFPRSHAPLTVQTITTVSDDPRSMPAGQVVVCEDEPAIRRVVSRMLRSCGLQVIECASADEAMRELARNGADIDLLISDIVMPGMSGVELMRTARQLRPGIPVMLMSGYAEGLFEDDTEAQPDAVLSKPFRGEELLAQVRGLLDRRP